MQNLIEKLNDPDSIAAFRARQSILFECYKAMAGDRSARKAELARTLADALQATITIEPPPDKKNAKPEVRPKYDRSTRIQLIEYLALVGGEAEVQPLAKLLHDLELREPARRALDAIGSPAATAALIAALDRCGPEFRIGVINTLARRGGQEAAAALRNLADDPDPQVRLAAIEALACFPVAGHQEILMKAYRTETPAGRDRIARACLRLAERLRDAGDKANARRIYQTIPHESPAQRQAAEAVLKTLH